LDRSVEPSANTPNDNAITGRAGIYPARYQSDEVDHTGPLVGRANRALRYVILVIAENLPKRRREARTAARAPSNRSAL
jgi:hypothetical protein